MRVRSAAIAIPDTVPTENVTSIVSGTVMDDTLPHVAVGFNPLEAYCRAVLSLVNESGNELAAQYLRSALNVLSTQPERE
uniref:Uncharacterized protein n=1 Tax=Agrobacterium vitis TaxID=373 RepID=A0A2Z2Q3W2_AGRVI|nr:hypothetical protein [Agrobacterium vitis]ASK49614.1 hypothetical protein [Agrobacterium vitis]